MNRCKMKHLKHECPRNIFFLNLTTIDFICIYLIFVWVIIIFLNVQPKFSHQRQSVINSPDQLMKTVWFRSAVVLLRTVRVLRDLIEHSKNSKLAQQIRGQRVYKSQCCQCYNSCNAQTPNDDDTAARHLRLN